MKTIDKLSADILIVAANQHSVSNQQTCKHLMPNKPDIERTRAINKLKHNNLIKPYKQNGREYFLNFDESYLSRGIVNSLIQEGFVGNLDTKEN